MLIAFSGDSGPFGDCITAKSADRAITRFPITKVTIHERSLLMLPRDLYDVEPFRMELAHRNSKFIEGCFDHVHHGVRAADEVMVFTAVYRQTPF